MFFLNSKGHWQFFKHKTPIQYYWYGLLIPQEQKNVYGLDKSPIFSTKHEIVTGINNKNLCYFVSKII